MEKPKDWKLTDKRYVALFDVMGFKDAVFRDETKVLTQMQHLLNQIKKIDAYYSATAVADEIDMIRTSMFSDTIILISKDDSEKTLEHMLYSANYLMISCFEDNIPIKGALSYGDITYGENGKLIFGKPIIDAHLLHDKLHLYSAVLDGNIEKKVKIHIGSNQKIALYVTPYDVPLKEAGVVKHYIVNWPKYFYTANTSSYSAEREGEINEYIEEMYHLTWGGIRKYVDNTKKFHDDMLFKIKNPGQ